MNYKLQKPIEKMYSYLTELKYKHIVSLIMNIKAAVAKATNVAIRASFDAATATAKNAVLDVGCLNENITTRLFMRLNKGVFRNRIDPNKVHGIDVEQWQGEDQHIPIADNERNKLVFSKVKNEYSKYPYPDNSFCIITCFNVLHHIDNPTFIVSEMFRVLAPGGYLIIKEHDIRNEEDAKYIFK